MEIIFWKEHVMNMYGPDNGKVVHCPSCDIRLDWDESWNEDKLIFFCPKCGRYAFMGKVISGERVAELTKKDD